MKNVYRLINLLLISYFLTSCTMLSEPQKEKEREKVKQEMVLCMLVVSRLFKEPIKDYITDPGFLARFYCGYNAIKESSEIESRKVF